MAGAILKYFCLGKMVFEHQNLVPKIKHQIEQTYSSVQTPKVSAHQRKLEVLVNFFSQCGY